MPDILQSQGIINLPLSEETLYPYLQFYSKGGAVIGGGAIAIGATVATYTKFTIPIIYATSDTPDKLPPVYSRTWRNGVPFRNDIPD